jgi:secreted PhoX family phosphatase
MRHTSPVALVLALTGLLGAGAAVAAPPRAGPSSSEGAYVLPLTRGVGTTALLTVGDAAANGYRLVGKPDGLGAFDNGDGTFTLLVNHELAQNAGIVRAHGTTGSFVSRWTIDSETHAVLSGEDLIRRQYVPAAAGGWTAQAITLGGLCSADLPRQGAFDDPASGTGTPRRLLLNGEEGGGGRAFGTVVDGPDAGSSYQLAGLGRAGWENQVTMPDTGQQTVVAGTDDNNLGELYLYVGEKRATGNDVERAGLTGGRLYGVRIEGVARESDTTTVPDEGAAFSLVEIPGAAEMNTVAALQAESLALGVSQLWRPEDSAWDPTHPGRLYMATTASQVSTSRLWRLDFRDPADVTAGGTARVAVSTPPALPDELVGPRSMDNLTVNDRGQVLVQEDRGPQPALSGIYQYDAATGGLRRIAEHDPDRFTLNGSRFLTESEESSGIIPAPFLGAGEYLLTSQAHYLTGDPETVEGGQLLLLHVPPGKPVR